jgi:hypothetical protein
MVHGEEVGDTRIEFDTILMTSPSIFSRIFELQPPSTLAASKSVDSGIPFGSPP